MSMPHMLCRVADVMSTGLGLICIISVFIRMTLEKTSAVGSWI